jgi:hypothetical protein
LKKIRKQFYFFFGKHFALLRAIWRDAMNRILHYFWGLCKKYT